MALQRAYAPYSKFRVGASIVLKNGKVITGCNIENVSFGLTICAERVALFNLISSGYNKNDVEQMNVIGETKDFICPCGACRQVMIELLDKETIINLGNTSGNIKTLKVKDLLPYSFEVLEWNQDL